MTVREAIDILEDCDPDAVLVDFDGEEFESIEDLGDVVEFNYGK